MHSSRFRFPFSNFHFPTSIFHFTLPFSTLQLPFSTFPPRGRPRGIYRLGAECRPIMCSYSVRGIHGPDGQPAMHSVLIIRHLQSGSWPTDRAFFNFPISNLERTLRHLQARCLTDHAHCKCLIIRTLRMVGQPPSL